MRKYYKYLAGALIIGLLTAFCNIAPVSAAGTILINNSNSASGPVGSTQTLTLYGFTTNETITVQFGTAAITPTPSTAPSSGYWTAAFNVPISPSGSYPIYARGSVSGVSNTLIFTLTPQITVSPTSGLPGASITVTGTGFQTAETNIVTNFDGNNIVGSTQTATSLGSWSNTFNVPDISAGAHTIHAAGTAGVDTTVSFTVIAVPKITVNPARGMVGSQVTVSGSGFAGSESGITVTFSNVAVSQTTNANSSGSWTLQFNIPETSGGSHSIGAYGNVTAAGAASNINFTVTPSISISPQNGAAGTLVTVSGTGFTASENNITITYDATDQGSSVRADSNGSWTNTFTVPVSSGGSHNVGAHGQSTSASAVAAAVFKIGAGISINKTTGSAGTAVTVSGSGFAANEQNIVISLAGSQIGSTTAGPTGTWTANVIIPAAAGGDQMITARGKTTNISTGPVFAVTATISIDKTSGPAGTTVTLTGAGFAANENGITVTFDGQRVGQPATATASGAWTESLTIPPSASGTHIISVNGSVTQLASAADLNFKVTTTIFLSLSAGFPGMAVTLTGSGFAASSTLQITFDDQPITNAGAVSADTAGNLNKTITIPAAQAGSHIIKVSDAQNDTDSKTFTIAGTAPAVPKPISPADGTKDGLFGGVTPTFKWSAITDARGETYNKGITYNLQVDTNADFSDPIVDVTGLTKTAYTLTRAEALPSGDYYWRVQAVDAAGNASEWSAPLALTSGTLSIAALILIILAFLVFLALLYILVIRRILANRRLKQAPATAPEIVIPEVMNAEYRISDADEASRRKALPWRLALPQAPATKGPRTLSAEDHARLKTIIDFARSLPLVEPGPDTEWLVGLAENGSGSAASPTLYSQMLRGEIPVKYEPAWIHHPTYLDLQTLLEGQPILQDLDSYVEGVNRSAGEAIFLLQDIYRDVSAEVTLDLFAGGGWSYISAVYSDAFSWFRGKNLREPSERDYAIKPEGGEGASLFSLNGEQITPFPGSLIRVPSEAEATQLRMLHLKLRRNYRTNDRAKELAGMIAQLEVQRNRLLNAFARFNRLSSQE